MFKFQFGESQDESASTTPSGEPSLVAAQLESLADLKQKAPRISYTVDNLGLPRRDLFDVRFQLMGQDVVTDEERLLLDGTEDVRKNVYEGGLKVWEGTNDLLHVLETMDVNSFGRVLELGCGAGIPSCYMFYRALTAGRSGEFVFADYNAAVLRLLTMPNAILTWLAASKSDLISREPGSAGELALTKDIVDAMAADLSSRDVVLKFVSGAWSKAFSDIVGPEHDLVLASETIYSLDSIRDFTDVLETAITPSGTGLIAAKKVYFGVGGGIVEFERLLDDRQLKHSVVYEKGNVGRVVLEVRN